MTEFNTELLKGKINLNDYIVFMFEVREQNNRIEKKLDKIENRLEQIENKLDMLLNNKTEMETEDKEDPILGFMQNILENDPEVKKAFGKFFGE